MDFALFSLCPTRPVVERLFHLATGMIVIRRHHAENTLNVTFTRLNGVISYYKAASRYQRNS